MKTKLFIAVPCCLMIIAAAIILGKALPAYWAKNDPDNPAKTTETDDSLRQPDKTEIKTDGRVLSKEEKMQDIEDHYPEKEEREDGTYYYKEINGIKTEDYYVINNDGSIFKSETVITEEELTALQKTLDQNPEFLQRTMKIPRTITAKDGSPDQQWESQTEPVTLIRKTDQGLQPIQIIRAVYTMQLPNGTEARYEKTFTMNLLNGKTTEEETLLLTENNNG